MFINQTSILTFKSRQRSNHKILANKPSKHLSE